MNKLAIYLCISFCSILLSVETEARVIQEGTVSFDLSGYNLSRRYGEANDTDEFKISVFGGYFFKDNLEIGSGLSYDDYKYKSDPQKRRSWTLSPGVLYHVPLNENANAYVGAGLFMTNNDVTLSNGDTTSEKSLGYTIDIGWEYFINPKIALMVSASYSHARWDSKGFNVTSSAEDRFFWPHIGLALFF